MDISTFDDDEIIDMYNKITEFIMTIEKRKINEEQKD